MAERDYLVLWPIYFDISRSRSEGRKLPRKLCVTNPRAEEILEAAIKLGLRARLEGQKKYPKFWWLYEGRVLVEKRDTKVKVLRQIALKLQEIRGRQHE